MSIFQFEGIVELLCFLGFKSEEGIYVMGDPGAESLKSINCAVQLIKQSVLQLENLAFDCTKSYTVQQQGVDKMRDTNPTNYVELLHQLRIMRDTSVKLTVPRNWQAFFLTDTSKPLSTYPS